VAVTVVTVARPAEGGVRVRALTGRRQLLRPRRRVTVAATRVLLLGEPVRPRDLRAERRVPLAGRRHTPAILGMRPSAPHIAVTSCCLCYLRFGKVTTSSRQMPVFATSSAISGCCSGEHLGKTSHYRTFHNYLAARSRPNVALCAVLCTE